MNIVNQLEHVDLAALNNWRRPGEPRKMCPYMAGCPKAEPGDPKEVGSDLVRCTGCIGEAQLDSLNLPRVINQDNLVKSLNQWVVLWR